jgi:predicted O-methyltransferase YrrM
MHYLFRSREISNFTYELANEGEIPAFLSGLLGTDREALDGYLRELRADEALLDELREGLRDSPRRNPEPLLGKRRLLYCLLRAERPGVVVESGVHDGIGSSVLLRALERNEAEGDPGRLVALDLNPDAGWLIDRDRHGGRLQLVIGDARETLEAVLERSPPDVFIHDSLKTHEHETFELEAAVRNRRGRLVLYTDDASSTGAMREVCARHGGKSGTLVEQPLRHYWRGNELGVCALGDY